MADLSAYIIPALTGLGAVVTWLVMQAIQLGKDLLRLEGSVGKEIQILKTAFSYYLEKTGVDSAKILASSINPTPPEMQELLKRYPDELTDAEKERLRVWLYSVMNDALVAKGERSIALQLLAAMDTIKRLVPDQTPDKVPDK